MTHYDYRRSDDPLVANAPPNHQPIHWRAKWSVAKRYAHEDDVRAGRYVNADYAAAHGMSSKLGQPLDPPYEILEREGNLLTYGGADLMWLAISTASALTATTGQVNTLFDAANAGIRVTSTTTPAAATDTNVNGSTIYASSMESGYPSHTTGAASTANADIEFQALFGTGEANINWNEWAVANSFSTNQGRILNHKVEDLGTKTSAASWTFTVKLSLS